MRKSNLGKRGDDNISTNHSILHQNLMTSYLRQNGRISSKLCRLSYHNVAIIFTNICEFLLARS